MELKKRGKREEVQNITIDISDGNSVCNGTVINVSIKGLGISDISSKFIEKASAKGIKRFTAVITNKNETIKINIVSRWAKKKGKNGIYANVGFEVAKNITDWSHFVMTKTSLVDEKDQDNCVWGGSDLKYMRV